MAPRGHAAPAALIKLSEHSHATRNGIIFSVGEEVETYIDEETKQTLTRSKSIPFEEWVALGGQLKNIAGSAMFLIGDWLAYGGERYIKSVWGDRMPNDVYAQVAQATGFAEGTLRNAKSMCSKLPLSLRSDKLTFNHALELVHRAKPQQYGYFISELEKHGYSVKVFRQVLRKAASSEREEPNDDGDTSLLEICRQFVRDFNAMVPKARVEELQECGKVLNPVWHKMGA